MQIVYSSPTLHSKTRTGLDKFWQGHISQEGDKWFTQTSHWKSTKGGGVSSKVFSEPYEAHPKNVGKKNETKAEDQAYFELDSIIKKQKDKGYVEEGEKEDVRPLPMLAQKFKDSKHRLTYPVYVQPKYNGERMLKDKNSVWSRKRQPINPQSTKHLVIDVGNNILDGELLLPGNKKLQETQRAIKTFTPGVSDTLEYIVFDLVDEKLVFSERYEKLKNLVAWASKSIKVAPAHLCQNEAEVLKWHKRFVKEGYEGTIIRDNHSGYEIGQRTFALQKHKDFLDKEFQIIGAKEGDGNYKGCCCFICITPEGKEFDCNPEGPLSYKRELWKNREKYIGKAWLTVRYQELSEEGKPLFPVGTDIRNPELANEA